jgi:hypothetical protein
MIKRSPFPNRSPAFPGNAVNTRSLVPLPIGNGNGNGTQSNTTAGQPFPSRSVFFERSAVDPPVTRTFLSGMRELIFGSGDG